ncbi:MAG: HAD-IIB family hydrolase, partial [Planctomycetes bacterium]|nr:HAD-IIB family hydrolase [Planctomycetota bacterium]
MSNSRKYRLLAVDIDGTLLNRGMLDEADVSALHAAARAGIIVCLCTGRSWPEAKHIWEQLDLPAPHAPVICAGGALVAEPDTGRTLYSRAFTRHDAQELAEQMLQMGYPVMALVDAWREGFDY